MLDKNPERKKSAPSTSWCCVIIQLDGFWNRPIQRKGCSSSRFRGNRGELFAEAESCETMARRTLATAYCTEQRTGRCTEYCTKQHTESAHCSLDGALNWAEFAARSADIESARHVCPVSEILVQPGRLTGDHI